MASSDGKTQTSVMTTSFNPAGCSICDSDYAALRCSKCKVSYYCKSECQRRHRETHAFYCDDYAKYKQHVDSGLRSCISLWRQVTSLVSKLDSHTIAECRARRIWFEVNIGLPHAERTDATERLTQSINNHDDEKSETSQKTSIGFRYLDSVAASQHGTAILTNLMRHAATIRVLAAPCIIKSHAIHPWFAARIPSHVGDEILFIVRVVGAVSIHGGNDENAMDMIGRSLAYVMSIPIAKTIVSPTTIPTATTKAISLPSLYSPSKCVDVKNGPKMNLKWMHDHPKDTMVVTWNIFHKPDTTWIDTGCELTANMLRSHLTNIPHTSWKSHDYAKLGVSFYNLQQLVGVFQLSIHACHPTDPMGAEMIHMVTIHGDSILQSYFKRWPLRESKVTSEFVRAWTCDMSDDVYRIICNDPTVSFPSESLITDGGYWNVCVWFPESYNDMVFASASLFLSSSSSSSSSPLK